MSVASPKNREEFKEYIFTKLGAPVLQVNVSDAQMDCCINDAFQYFNERSHFLGTERMYLTTQADSVFVEHFKSKKQQLVDQVGGPKVYEAGMVDELTLVDSGSGYPSTSGTITTPADDTSDGVLDFDLNSDGSLGNLGPGKGIDTEDGLDLILDTAAGSGSGLTVYIGPERTVDQGLVNARPYNAGSGYKVGEFITIKGSTTDNSAIFQITKVKEESLQYGIGDIATQNNYIVLPDDVVGVQQVLTRGILGGLGMGGIIPGGMVGPMLMGGLLGDSCSGIGFDIVSYVAMREWLATLDFLFSPPVQYNFNMRTHRLFIDSGRFANINFGDWICLECMVKPSPDVYPDLWNDMWIKEYCIALVQVQWGRNLTKYNQVQLPGGITLDGLQILRDGQQNRDKLKERFAMDWADPALDAVG